MNRGLARLAAGFTLALALGVSITPTPADAFCGFYVAGADASLYNDATMVVLMRDGKRTVLSMQNAYQGPPEDFALVIPVPVVLQEDNVKILPQSIFDRVDRLAAPRLVEYWEEDPCAARIAHNRARERRMEDGAIPSMAPMPESGVTVEAEFAVGEYQIVILSAQDSTGLETWLRQEKYNIPAGAEPVLRPYVEGGMKFFVAKVDIDKVQFASQPDGSKRAMLSPLRFHYDSDEFNLPIRLGLINANGPQDLLVHILAKQRYQAANYPNVTIPTNLVVNDRTRERFGEFYVSLFDHTLAQAQTPSKPVVTEYAWAAGNCDPCPENPLDLQELILLGANVLPSYAASFDEQGKVVDNDLEWRLPNEFVLTRLHARYDKASLGEDLVFETAQSILGGRGEPQDGGKLDPAVTEQRGDYNAFQARYAILHAWEGAVQCKDPLWDSWGGPPSGAGSPGPAVARELAFVARDTELATYVSAAAHQTLKLAGAPPAEPTPKRATPTDAGKPDAGKSDAGKPDAKPEPAGCQCSVDQPDPSGPLAALLGLGLLGFVRSRRR